MNILFPTYLYCCETFACVQDFSVNGHIYALGSRQKVCHGQVHTDAYAGAPNVMMMCPSCIRACDPL